MEIHNTLESAVGNMIARNEGLKRAGMRKRIVLVQQTPNSWALMNIKTAVRLGYNYEWI